MIYFLHWYAIDAPVWLLKLGWNIQRALVRLFSVEVMVKTLFAHWRRDVVSYARGSMGSILLAFAWNQISRLIGFIVRLNMLLAWAGSAVLVVLVTGLALFIFLAWPFAALAGFVSGMFLLG